MCTKAFPQAGQLYSHKKTHGINPRVTKDPKPGVDTPQRGRKRKNKNPEQVVLSPPHVAYLVESFHQPGHYQSLSSTTKPKKNKANNPRHNPGLLEIEDNETKSRVPDTDLHGRRKLIPVTRDQYQHFLQNQQMYFQSEQHNYHNLPPSSHYQQLQQHQQQQQHQSYQQPHSYSNQYHHRLDGKTVLTSNPTTSTLTQNHQRIDLKPFEVIKNSYSTSQSNKIKTEETPAHLKDLERLIPSDQT